MPAARALSSPSGETAEDNVEERENSEVTQFLAGRGTGTDDDDGRTDRIFLSNIILDIIGYHRLKMQERS